MTNIRELRDSFPEKCIISWEVKESDLAWQRQVGVGEYYRPLHSIGAKTTYWERTMHCSRTWRKPSIPEQRMRGAWGKLRLEPLAVARLCRILGHMKEFGWG